ncbi:acetylacetone-cleaving protein [Rhodospirillaceae bacterium KN72]|uniref:Acetylacetone-cleaving protein n=1 Tax=Pacificispira spongiicola TaxID=2729598 RepID=A0A7Y0E124_9PROT|nr:acetylacetone-cleaving protein [Pacificispira spongiicola]NMM45236.1 acetylacetone-cleaving protein [Pacificispira spongiicola]
MSGSYVSKTCIPEEYVQIDEQPWAPFPDALSEGGIRWKFLHASPEMGAWTAIFDCPAGSSFAAHIHIGPGEYFLTKGKMDVRGGKDAGGDTAFAPGYGYESANARHDKTYFPVASEFYMTFLGPLVFIKPDATPVAVVGWEEAQGAWNAFLESQKSAAE